EHIGNLGTVDLEHSVDARIAFWRHLHERLSRLSNRVDQAKLGAILSAVHARVPMVPIPDVPAVNVARAERGLKSWRQLRASGREQVALHQALKATIERKIETWEKEAARAQAGVDAAEATIADPTKPAPPEPTAKEVNRILREAGITKQHAH